MAAGVSDVFLQLGIVVIVAALGTLVLRFFKQPQLLAYVLVGIFLTPVFGIVTDTSIIASISIIGIAFLLFIVGLEIDLKKLKSVSLISSVGGAISISVLFTTGYLVALLLGFLNIEAIYLGLMISFSSTMVIMKLLSDRRELNTLHGRVVVGILLMEDIVAIFALSILASLNGFSMTLFGVALLKFAVLFVLAFICSKVLFPRIFRFAARSQELLLLSSLAVCFLFALAFEYLGFSVAIGAFIAGLTLGNLKYNHEIIARMKPLRDFFALLFFVSLGMNLSLSVLKTLWIPLVVFTLFSIFLKPTLLMLLSFIFRYTKKPAFLIGMMMSNIGEFSLIVVSSGLALGHVSQELFSLVVIITIITITITSYLLKFRDGIYNVLEKPLNIFSPFIADGMEYSPTETKHNVVLCGYNRIGFSILKELDSVKKKTLIVDFNPEVISKLAKKGYHCLYGNAADEEIIEKMHFRRINLFVSTIPNLEDNMYLVDQIRKVNKKARVIIAASNIDEALKLYKHGADYVVMPHFLGGEHASQMISKIRSKKIKVKQEKKRQVKMLEERKEVGHKHPEHH